MQSFRISCAKHSNEFVTPIRQIRTDGSCCSSSKRCIFQEERPRLVFRRKLEWCLAQGRDHDHQWDEDLAISYVVAIEDEENQSLVSELDLDVRQSSLNSDDKKSVKNIVFGISCVVSLMAAVSRSSFSLLVLTIQQEFGLKMQDVGALQSSLLLGYMLGQVCRVHAMCKSKIKNQEICDLTWM